MKIYVGKGDCVIEGVANSVHIYAISDSVNYAVVHSTDKAVCEREFTLTGLFEFLESIGCASAPNLFLARPLVL
jgi:hypothetical protein